MPTLDAWAWHPTTGHILAHVDSADRYADSSQALASAILV
jgi:hypothetical protein